MKKSILFLASLLTIATTVTAQKNVTTRANVNDYPFELTTDSSAPKLYYIYSGRDGNGERSPYVFANEIPYKESEYKLNIVYKNPNKVEANQLWYFMEEEGRIKIISASDNRMVTISSTDDSPKCVFMKHSEEITNEYYTWNLDLTDGYYAFKTSDERTYLSHNGNWQTAGPQMGLYNANGKEDEGSRVFFEACPNGAETVVDEILPTENTHQKIYTLSGLRIEKITVPGVYIVNGNKMVIK